MVLGILLKFARAAVEGVLGQIMQQVNVIQDQVLQVIMNQLNPLRDAWKGQGANRFFDEMENQVVPNIRQMMSYGGDYAGNIRKAMDLIEGADQRAMSIVNGILDEFNIF
ncbi:MAG: WXG100 family type VII secretion target [Phototrophicales bacterium]|nr:WXG100 family type VII secretion target [Phototrophicales bacterium]